LAEQHSPAGLLAVARPAHGAGAWIRAHGGRATPARRLLLGALVENPGHSSAEERAAYGLGAAHVQVDRLRETTF
jgi:hypothetical protein